MAKFPTVSPQFIAFLASLLISSIATTLLAMEDHQDEFVRAIDRERLGLIKEKLSHFKLYWHDVVSGANPSGAQILPALNGSKTAFGLVRIIDNPLTMGPELGSKLMGRAQGLYTPASQEEVGLLMIMNFAFTQGKYNGSSITVMGRNPVFSAVREMPVVGGSGLFRFARGYVQLRTHTFNANTGDATVEYNAYVLHY